MRGLAALAVLGFHLYSPPLEQGIAPLLPAFGRRLLDHGWLGVQVFFVLSGFVIAHSLRGVEATLGFLGRFVLRRSIRLDPPYWMTIFAVLVSLQVSNWVFTERTLEFPSVGAVVTHLFYLQEILGFRQLVDVFWTLCVELQLYLVLACLLVLRRWVGSISPGSRAIGWATWLVGAGLALASLAVAGFVPEARKIWFLSFWYQFFLGSLTYWTISGHARSRNLAMLMAATAALAALAGPEEPLVSAATAFLLWIAGRRNSLGNWLSGPTFRFLGRVSYSLYLTHTLVISRGVNLLGRLGALSGREGLIALLLGASALGIASLWHFAFERPSIKLSRRVSLVPAKHPLEPPEKPA